MLAWILFSLLFYLLLSLKELYILSGILPHPVRRSWINMVYPDEKSKWNEYHAFLKQHFPYFKLLNNKEKGEFLVRLFDFKNQIPVEGREGIEIDEQKHVLLSASLSQITFGYQGFRLSNFQKIIIYPEIFYSKYLDTEVKGITYSSGYIYLSWQDFEEGYLNFKNKINLGLHEFAHALMLEKNRISESNEYEIMHAMFAQLSRKIDQTGDEDPIFRNYGFTNFQEFWAVSVEVFFEQPIQLQKTYPNLYKVLTKLLQQDMAKRLNQYLQNRGNSDSDVTIQNWT